MSLTILGSKVSVPVKQLEAFPAPAKLSRVVFECMEFTSLCPMTGQPDFCTLRIEYVPAALCLESKSLKLYLWTFRESGAFVEQLATEIAGDIQDAIAPAWLQVVINQSVRGGIALQATCIIGENEHG